MKKYYIRYWADFGNTFEIFWADEKHRLPEKEMGDFERISRKAALKKLSDWKNEEYCPKYIYPIDADPYDEDDRRYEINGKIVDYR